MVIIKACHIKAKALYIIQNLGIGPYICTTAELRTADLTSVVEGVIDCVVMVCEGCGTVIIDDAEMIQGIGGRVSGLVKTTPIPEVIRVVGEDRVLSPSDACIDQVEGVRKAISLGFRNIAVTVTGYVDLDSVFEENPECNVYTFGVHTSKLSESEARKLVDNCDVTTACASKYVRKFCEEKAIFKVGEEIPIYALSNNGELFLKMRLDKIGGVKPPKSNPRSPDPLI